MAFRASARLAARRLGWLAMADAPPGTSLVNTAEDITFHADRDYSALPRGRSSAVCGARAIRATRYGIKGDANVVTSAAYAGP